MAASESGTDWQRTRLAQNPRFDVVQVEDESLLYDSETHNVIYLDAPALVVWRLCDGERSLADIAQLIERAYPQSRDAIANDVEKTVDALTKSGALVLRA
ncbi:MAG TPA: PqqD family protein [Polyangiales bacterium]|nr:PqqD family protein [Polyangiales bacterium]